MVRVHLNWSECRDWRVARSDLRHVVNATLYGNFADATVDDVGELERQLKARGFTVSAQSPNRSNEDVRFVLYRAQ